MVMDEVSQCRAVSCKTIHKGGRENIKVIRIAIMEGGPDDLYAVLFGCFERGDKGGEIKSAGSFNERPACPFTDRPNIEISQQFVITGHQAIVLGELQHIQTLPSPIDMTGRLKACQEKRIK